MQSFLVALAFLTIIPVRSSVDQHTLARSRFWYPVVGLVLGTLLGGWAVLVSPTTLPTANGMFSAFVVLATWVVITGALHLDGFCDLCDGLFGGATPEERLGIMKQPTRGAFAIVGALLLLLGKFAALHELFQKAWPYAAAWSVGMAITVSRGLVLSMAAGAHYPRAQGTGKILIEATQWRDVTYFLAISAVFLAAGPFAVTLWPCPYSPCSDSVNSTHALLQACRNGVGVVAVMLFPLLCVLFLLGRTCERRLGGITGDCLGAAIELLELIFLLLAVCCLPGKEIN